MFTLVTEAYAAKGRNTLEKIHKRLRQTLKIILEHFKYFYQGLIGKGIETDICAFDA